jgi:hypothetical protein
MAMLQLLLLLLRLLWPQQAQKTPGAVPATVQQQVKQQLQAATAHQPVLLTRCPLS